MFRNFFIVFFLLVIGSVGVHAQHSMYVGASMDVGGAYNNYAANKSILKPKGISYQWQGGLFAQYRMFNRIGIEIGISQNFTRLALKDAAFSSRNGGYESTVKNRNNYWDYYAGLQFLQPIAYDPVGKPETFLYLGAGYVFNRVGNKSVTQSKLFTMNSETVTVTSNYLTGNNAIVGEIGIQQIIDGGGFFSIGLKGCFGRSKFLNGSYTVTDAIGGVITQDNFYSSGNFVGLNIKLGIALFDKVKEQNTLAQQQAEYEILKRYNKNNNNINNNNTINNNNNNNNNVVIPKSYKDEAKDRTIKVTHRLTVKNPQVTVTVWDHQEVDGDRISLNLNGNWILNDYTLKREPYSFNITLQPGQNLFVLHALNLGKYSPNTAAMVVKDGTEEHKLILESTMSESGTIEILYVR
jgi:hypothetical protein